MSFFRIAALTMLCATAAGAQEIVGRGDRVFTASERISAGDDVRIYSANGRITITQATGSTMEFRAEKEGGDSEDVGFVILRGSNGITICAVYDEDDECTSSGIDRNRSRRWNDWNRRARPVITASVPRGVHLFASSGNGDVSVDVEAADARVTSGNGRVNVSRINGEVTVSSGNGRVTVEDVSGPVSARSGNGDVLVTSAMGPVTATTGNGSVRASMARLGSGDMVFTSGNGSINLEVPSDFSADVDASTGSGGISTDFPISVQGRLQRNRLRGTIGEGGRTLRLRTGNGSVSIRKGAR